MKLQFKTSPTIASEDMEVTTMGVAGGAGDMLTMFLRDKIYKDKTLACVRETITNAQDEHVKHNIDRDVDIRLTLVDGSWVWSVRDYAKGLSAKSIRTVFGMYGGSDKRDNNLQVGGFGIGALSPFASSDTFYVTSYHEGMMSKYACILGAGENGIPVGEIYAVNEPEPTTETGLEVSLEVNSSVLYEFENKTNTFVKRFLPDAKITYYQKNSAVVTPLQPLLSEKIGDYTFHRYSSDFNSYDSHSVAIRMGGVVYRMEHRCIMEGTMDGKLVVDVPIGKLSIPISREELEETQANDRVFTEIEAGIKVITDREKAAITTPIFGKEILEGGFSRYHTSPWFTYDVYTSFPNSFELARWVNKERYNYAHSHNGNGKYTIYLIPDIDSYRSWIKRLENFYDVSGINQAFRWCRNTVRFQKMIEADDVDLSDIDFIDVKKAGLPRLPSLGGKVSYLAYYKGHKKGSFTADELESYAVTKWGEVDFDEEWWTTLDDENNLTGRAIGLSSDYGSYSGVWTTNSKKLCEYMYTLGWLDPKSVEFTKTLSDMRAEADRKRAIAALEVDARSAIFRIAPKDLVLQNIVKNPDKLSILKGIRTKILAEDSPRGRILQSISSYGHSMTRSDLRKILLLK